MHIFISLEKMPERLLYESSKVNNYQKSSWAIILSTLSAGTVVMMLVADNLDYKILLNQANVFPPLQCFMCHRQLVVWEIELKIDLQSLQSPCNITLLWLLTIILLMTKFECLLWTRNSSKCTICISNLIIATPRDKYWCSVFILIS